MHLLTDWYIDPSAERRRELETCLQRNLEHDTIEGVHLFGRADDLQQTPLDPKITLVPVANRATFARFFDYAGRELDGETCAVANADCYFDETLERLHEVDLSRTCLCLTRWDVVGLAPLQTKFYDHPGSHDAWIFRAPLWMPEATYPPGTHYCDKKLAWQLAQKVLIRNPSRSIHVLHLHLSGVRNRDLENPVPCQPPPYAAGIDITELPIAG